MVDRQANAVTLIPLDRRNGTRSGVTRTIRFAAIGQPEGKRFNVKS